LGARRLPPCDDYRWINGCVEELSGLSHIVKLDDLGLPEEIAPDSTAGERSPELGRNEKRYRSAFARQCDGSLDEQRRQIHLRSESATGASGLGACLPRGFPEDDELAHEEVLRMLTDVVQSHSRRVADDYVETAASSHVRELSVEGKGQRASAEKCAPG
jgi:hypothetical protein